MEYKVKNVKDKFEEHSAKDECHHYWIIESANGPTSRGVCKFCGAEKDFFNSLSGDSTVVKGHTSPLELPKLDVEPDTEQNNS